MPGGKRFTTLALQRAGRVSNLPKCHSSPRPAAAPRRRQPRSNRVLARAYFRKSSLGAFPVQCLRADWGDEALYKAAKAIAAAYERRRAPSTHVAGAAFGTHAERGGA